MVFICKNLSGCIDLFVAPQLRYATSHRCEARVNIQGFRWFVVLDPCLRFESTLNKRILHPWAHYRNRPWHFIKELSPKFFTCFKVRIVRRKGNRAVLNFPSSLNSELIVTSNITDGLVYRFLPTDFPLWNRYETGTRKVGDPSTNPFKIRWTVEEAIQWLISVKSSFLSTVSGKITADD